MRRFLDWSSEIYPGAAANKQPFFETLQSRRFEKEKGEDFTAPSHSVYEVTF